MGDGMQGGGLGMAWARVVTAKMHGGAINDAVCRKKLDRYPGTIPDTKMHPHRIWHMASGLLKACSEITNLMNLNRETAERLAIEKHECKMYEGSFAALA